MRFSHHEFLSFDPKFPSYINSFLSFFPHHSTPPEESFCLCSTTCLWPNYIFKSMKGIIFLAILAIVYGKNCHHGPSYWCLSDDTARECGAINFCARVNQNIGGEKDDKIKFHPKNIKNTLDAAPVNVTLYYEALCPACRQLIMNQIWPTFNKLKNTGILNLKFVPYGNAQQRQYGNQWTFYCQHGPAECLGNMLESCAMYHYPKLEECMPFLHCMEYYQPTLQNAQYCASLAKINYNAIYSCAYSEEGNKVEHQMGVETESLNPPHQYVPWVTMNGYHSSYIQNELSTNMLNYVCQSYRGTKPKECYAAEELPICEKKEQIDMY